jgi:hypothetical protein
VGLIDIGIAALWNNLFRNESRKGLLVGHYIKDGEVSKRQATISESRRPEHIAILGKTGTGKSTLLRYFMSQDIQKKQGFLCIDLHGDLIPFVLASLREQEQKTGQDLSKRLLLVDPADLEYAVGLNLIESQESTRAVLISEMVALLRQRWSLDHFGARTEELLRNALWVLSENGLTLLEVSLLLTNSAYRSRLLAKVSNAEVRNFFRDRYDKASNAMQAVMREAVLNKMTAFTVDQGIRHIVGQQHSSFSLRRAIDQGFWVLLDLRKGRLGENASTFAGLFLMKLKNAIFGRKARTLFTLYADELPNLVSAEGAFETLLSECRKFAISVVTANQFLNQFPPAMRSALVSVGTVLCFQLSAEDAPFMARALDGEGALVRRLMTLPHRQLIGRFGDFAQQMFVPQIERPRISATTLIQRSLKLFAKPRQQIEDEINARKPTEATSVALEDWD